MGTSHLVKQVGGGEGYTIPVLVAQGSFSIFYGSGLGLGETTKGLTRRPPSSLT